MLRRLLGLPLAAGVALALLGGFFFGVPVFVDGRMNRLAPGDPLPVTAAGRALHESIAVADLHDDLLLWDRGVLGPSARGHTDVTRLARGGVAVQVFSTVTKTPKGQNYERNGAGTDNITLLAVASRWPPATWRSLRARALHQARKLGRAASLSEGRVALVRSAADLRNALQRRAEWQGDAAHRPVAALLSTEGLQALDGELAGVDTLFAHGFRLAGLAHFFDNAVAGSAHGEAKGGLTPLGRDVVRRMESLRMIVDLAHSSPATFDEVLAIATRPVIVSHVGVQATCPGPRNLTDAQLRAVAANGGLVGIGFWDGAICGTAPRDVARAIAHAVAVAGARHVALGSDWDGATTVQLAGDELAQLTQALLDAGLDGETIRAVMGGNAIRFLLEQLP